MMEFREIKKEFYRILALALAWMKFGRMDTRAVYEFRIDFAGTDRFCRAVKRQKAFAVIAASRQEAVETAKSEVKEMLVAKQLDDETLACVATSTIKDYLDDLAAVSTAYCSGNIGWLLFWLLKKASRTYVRKA